MNENKSVYVTLRYHNVCFIYIHFNLHEVERVIAATKIY